MAPRRDSMLRDPSQLPLEYMAAVVWLASLDRACTGSAVVIKHQQGTFHTCLAVLTNTDHTQAGDGSQESPCSAAVC